MRSFLSGYQTAAKIKRLAPTPVMTLICAVILTALGCRSTKVPVGLPPAPPIDSLGAPVVYHQNDTTYLEGPDTVVKLQQVPFADYVHPGGALVVTGGILAVKVPRYLQRDITRTTTVQQPVFKENLTRVNILTAQQAALQQQLDKTKKQLNDQADLARKAQARQAEKIAVQQAKIDQLIPYKNVILWGSGIIIGLILVVLIVRIAGWKFSGVLGLVGRLFKR